jgi:hypothetical protein
MSGPMFRNRFDYASKDILRASLEPDGAFESDAEVFPDAQPIQWIVSAGRPDGGIEGLALLEQQGWPRGVYRSPRLLHTWLVVASELPETRETLMLRLMGAGRVLQGALAELRALPPEARERAIAMPVLLRYRLEVPADPGQRTSHDEEFLMSTHPIVEAWEREKEAKGEARGRLQGIAEGLILTYENRFGVMPTDLREIVQETRDDAALRAWFKVALSGTAEDFAAAVRRDQAA